MNHGQDKNGRHGVSVSVVYENDRFGSPDLLAVRVRDGPSARSAGAPGAGLW